jgi:Flp pilus assembly protein TadG
MIELALVAPFLILLAFGTAEFGMAWVTGNRVEASSSTAARIGSSSGSQPEADLAILQSLKASLPAEELANLDRVVVFLPSSATGTVPSACIPAFGSTSNTGVTNSCNSYSGAFVRSLSSTATDPVVMGTSDDAWAPSTRKDRLSSAARTNYPTGGPDYLGVYVRTRHDQITNTFWGDFTIDKTSIFRIQPDIQG